MISKQEAWQAVLLLAVMVTLMVAGVASLMITGVPV